jgi:hypothetical protein
VGILVGLSLCKSTEFGDGVAANPGDTWSTAGALPTKEVFNRQSLGLMLAVALDVEILPCCDNVPCNAPGYTGQICTAGQQGCSCYEPFYSF